METIKEIPTETYIARLKIVAEEAEVEYQLADKAHDRARDVSIDAKIAYEAAMEGRKRGLFTVERMEAMEALNKTGSLIFPESVLTMKDQHKTFTTRYAEDDQEYEIKTDVRYGDGCQNGHNSFVVTADIHKVRNGQRGAYVSGGCLHEEISKHFPHLTEAIKFHLVSTDGPMHYLANTLYHVEEGKMDFARDSACWPEATDDDLQLKGLVTRLVNRLPGLMADFKVGVEGFGFTY